MEAIWAFGSDAHRETWLPGLAAGTLIGCFGLTEAGAGSDPAGSMQSSYTAIDDGFHVVGEKRWITNAPLADLAIVWARDPHSAQVAGFVIPTTTPGFKCHRLEHKASLRLASTGALEFDIVVPESARLPNAQGLGAALACLNQARFGIVWGTIGAALDAYQEALDFATHRIAFGRPIAATQMVQERLVAMQSAIVDMQLKAMQLTRLGDSGQLRYPQVCLAKRQNARSALDVARMAREILGAHGIILESPSIRHMANLETVDTYEGTYEIHTLAVGRDITGLSAF